MRKLQESDTPGPRATASVQNEQPDATGAKHRDTTTVFFFHLKLPRPLPTPEDPNKHGGRIPAPFILSGHP